MNCEHCVNADDLGAKQAEPLLELLLQKKEGNRAEENEEPKESKPELRTGKPGGGARQRVFKQRPGSIF